MPPPQPESCRRENTLRFILSLFPALSCVAFASVGRWDLFGLVFGLTFIVIGYGCIIPRARLFCHHISELPHPAAEKGQVWITLDDGPDPATTPALLAVLDRHQAKAGFFLIGDKAQKHPELVREIAQRGHLIGNHSQTHPAGRFWTLRPTEMWQEIASCQETLRGILGTDPVWFRPPVGHHNLFIAPVLKALGLTMAIWNCRGFDGIEKRADVILHRISRSVKPGSIILLHDATPVCVEVLERTLLMLEERQLSPVLPD